MESKIIFIVKSDFSIIAVKQFSAIFQLYSFNFQFDQFKKCLVPDGGKQSTQKKITYG
jgi:hypothetical protein